MRRQASLLFAIAVATSIGSCGQPTSSAVPGTSVAQATPGSTPFGPPTPVPTLDRAQLLAILDDISYVPNAVPAPAAGGKPTLATMRDYLDSTWKVVEAFWIFSLSGVKPYSHAWYSIVEPGNSQRSNCRNVKAGDPAEDPAFNPAFWCSVGGELAGGEINEPVVYLSTSWLYRRLSDTVGPENFDFAVASVVAHEAGHNVEQSLGFRSASGICCNLQSVHLELMADCFGGVWAHHSYASGVIDDHDIEEATSAAWSFGSDEPASIDTAGYHGTRSERVAAFKTGFTSGTIKGCVTSETVLGPSAPTN